mgnify:CR=1 FL=1
MMDTNFDIRKSRGERENDFENVLRPLTFAEFAVLSVTALVVMMIGFKFSSFIQRTGYPSTLLNQSCLLNAHSYSLLL